MVASAAPICASCSGVSCVTLTPNSSRDRISSCGISGVLLRVITGASA
jgi:hypothetical protein